MRTRLALVLASLVSLLVAAPAYADGAARDPAPDPKVAQLEVDVMTGMIPHHRSAIAMAQMALDKATHPEVKQLAQSIIDSQTAEIDTMSHWLRDWYGVQPPADATMTPAMMAEMDMPMEHGTMPDMAAQMQALQQKSGADFEVAFLSDMAKHHAMAIMMASPVLTSGYHADLYRLAVQITLSQGREISQIDDWLNAWYGIPRPV